MSTALPILFAAGISNATVDWREPPASLPDLREDVHLWRLPLAIPDPSLVAKMEQTLSVDERARASGFHSAVHRDSYVVGRACLRAILARYIGCTAAAVAFEYGGWGKPRLAGGTTPEFNLSHAEDLGLLAVRRHGGAVGVDVEFVGRPLDHLAIARQYFRPAEARAVAEAGVADRAQTFLRLWTRREALFKASGIGLSGLCKTSPLPDADPRCLVHTLFPAAGYIAALAIAD
jgi:4'-phosphopantetheinyl transferase